MISFREILKGTISRFVPGAIIGQSLMIALLLIGEPTGLGWQDVAPLAMFTTMLGAGHLGVLAVVRRLLRPDANVAGRRALISGLAAGAFHFGIAAYVGNLTVADGYVLGIVAGAAGALSMFFPWIRTRRDQTPDTAIPAHDLDDLALMEPSGLDWPPRSDNVPEHVRSRTPS